MKEAISLSGDAEKELRAALVQTNGSVRAEDDLRYAPFRADVDAKLPMRSGGTSCEVVAAAGDEPIGLRGQRPVSAP